MLLALDIGNTNVTIGVFGDSGLVTTIRAATDSRRSPDEYGLLLTSLLQLNGVQREEITEVSMCSVVPPLTGVFEEVASNYFGVQPLTVTGASVPGCKSPTTTPATWGPTASPTPWRPRSCTATRRLSWTSAPPPCSTSYPRRACTSAGAIAPGISVAAEALFLNTSQLRRIELTPPPSAIGQNTTSALQAGLVLGYAELVKGLVGRIKGELGGFACVVATGGLADVISRETGIFDHINPNLTLIGLRQIYDLNQNPD